MKQNEPRSCGDAQETCDDGPTQTGNPELRGRAQTCLASSGVKLEPEAFDHLVDQLANSIQKRKDLDWSKVGTEDIAYHIQCARDDGDLDEAYWRAFLVGHFGPSSTPATSPARKSAARLLCDFGSSPHWTWKTVHKDPEAFRDGLLSHKADLADLDFGNHRKFESKKPKNLWRVIKSFLALAAQHDDLPSQVFAAASDANDATPQFRKLYDRLRDVRRFGRTACFDLLVFMDDLRLIDAKPDSCYLKGSSGPLHGAKQLWGNRSIEELEDLAVQLARQLDVSPQVVEDALCNWQK